MKLTKRMKNSILQGISFSVIFFVILLWVFFILIYPQITQIEEKKKEFANTFQDLQTISKDWLWFTDFKSIIQSKTTDSYIRSILINIDKGFFDQNFTNTWTTSYLEYLKEREQYVQEKKSSSEFIRKEQSLDQLLPTYDKDNSFAGEGLTDFYFINSIENLLYTFNLSYIWDIGVGELINVEEEQNSASSSQQSNQANEAGASSLIENIYRIPISLSIEGQKSDIIDFLHYFENVSSVSISNEGFNVYEDSFIGKRIEWSAPSVDYNIYENQLADISSVQIRDYPDSSSLQTEGLIAAMKWPQSKEKLDIEIEISFYVAWVPSYKMQTLIQEFIQKQKELWAKIKQNAQKYSTQKYKYSDDSNSLVAIQKIESLSLLMLSFDDEVKKISPKLWKLDEIELLYEQVLELANKLDRIESYYNQQLEILTKQ